MLSITESQQKGLNALFSLIIINIPIGIAINYASQKKYLEFAFKFTILLAATIVTYLVISWIFNFFKTKNTFWNKLRPHEKVIIDEYINKSINVLRFELKFNMEDDYVELSGQPGNPTSLIPQQAYKERGSSGRINIKNLDRYLLSPSTSKIFIYGAPGSGKSTTLYKALIHYGQNFIKKNGYHIPVHIHANDIDKLVNTNLQGTDILSFIELAIGKKYPEFERFISVCNQKASLNFVIIIDALDEFLDKGKRGELFSFLSSLMEQDRRSRWILSCREEEYKAYEDKLNVTNIRIRPMSLSQIQRLLNKRLNSFQEDRASKNKIRRTIFSILQANSEQETFLRNPYYLSLWLHEISFSSDTDEDHSIIPSIRGLHNFELKREIARGSGLNPDDAKKVDKLIFESQLEILSVLSFYLLNASLTSQKLTNGVLNVCSPQIILSLANKYKILEDDEKEDDKKFDKITLKRIAIYEGKISAFNEVNLANSTEDQIFVKIVNQLIQYFNKESLNIRINRKRFVIVISSILEQAYTYGLIDLDCSKLSFSRFLNQRAGDYLAASYLDENNLVKKLITKGEVNFWLFRSLAIAIAISEEPQSILDARQVSQDPILATATVNGLSLVKSTHKSRLKTFTENFVDYLLSDQNFSPSHPSYDPCAPLRALRIVTRLSSNGYANYFTLSRQLFKKLLTTKDSSISDAAAITLMAYSSRVTFRGAYWKVLFRYFLVKAFQFELSWRSVNGFITVIYKGIVGDE